MDVSQLLEDPDVVVAPGMTSLPRQAPAPEPEPEPDTIFDVEVLDAEEAPAPDASEEEEQPEDDLGSFFDESQNAQTGGTPAQPLSPMGKTQKASETFMVPQENLEPEFADDAAAFGGDDDFSLDDDGGSLNVDDTDMVADVSDMLDDLDDD
jgi:hypothetical protein